MDICIPAFFAAYVLRLIFYCTDRWTLSLQSPIFLRLESSEIKYYSLLCPSYTTLQPGSPHTPPISQHRHPFSTSSPTIISTAQPKHPSLFPHSAIPYCSSSARICQKRNWVFVGDLRLGPLDVLVLELGDGLVRRALESWLSVLTEKNVGFVLDGAAGEMRKIISAIGVVYFTDWVLIKWHDALVNVNCRRYDNLSCWGQIN